jgi:hypothetical protein
MGQNMKKDWLPSRSPSSSLIQFLSFFVIFITSLPPQACASSSSHLHSSRLIHYASPQLHWMQKLPGDETIGRGNIVVGSPTDDDTLYVTTGSGKLYVVSRSTGSVVTTIQPPIHTSRDSDGKLVGWTTHCNSGIAFGEIESIGKFLVYSVVDHPPEEREDLSPTRYAKMILCCNRNHNIHSGIL